MLNKFCLASYVYTFARKFIITKDIFMSQKDNL